MFEEEYKAFVRLFAISAAVLVVVAALVILASVYDRAPSSLTFVDRGGRLIGTVDSSYSGLQIWLPLKEIPKQIITKTIESEDRFFFWHGGINPVALGKAFLQNLRHGHVVRGGSTITQQLAKNLIQRKHGNIVKRTLVNKILESALALGLEIKHSKNWVLEQYLNTSYYGHRCFGIEAAARVYFSKEAVSLTDDEIAALIRATRSPVRVAALMPPSPVSINQVGRHFMNYVSGQIKNKKKSVRLNTTLDVDIQRSVENAVKSGLDGRRDMDSQITAAAVVIDVASGDILAMTGSRSYFDDSIAGQVNASVSLRQPGSALKPFTYFSAFTKGYGPNTIVPDEPMNFMEDSSKPLNSYSPQNFDRKYHGPITMRDALANSYNIPAVATLGEVGVSYYHEILRRFGFTTFTKPPSYYGLAVTLGSGEVTLLELVNAYAALARGGIFLPYRFLKSSSPAEPKPVIEDSQVFASEIVRILSDPSARRREFGFNESMIIEGHDVAIKTGTSYEHRDNWAIGISPSYAVGVWVGHADASPMEPEKSTGAMAAAPIWHSIMEGLLRGAPVEKFHVAENFGASKKRLESGALKSASKGFKIVSPMPNAQYRTYKAVPGEHQKIKAEVRVMDKEETTIFNWYIDGEFFDSTDAKNNFIFMTPTPGEHELLVESSDGERQRVLFNVNSGDTTLN